MKNRMMLCMLCAALVSLLCGCRPSAAKVSVGFLDGLNYGMSPKEVTEQLGAPIQVEDDIDLLGAVFYSYNLELEGHQAIVTFTFVEDKSMSSVFSYVPCGSAETAAKLFETWKAKEIAAHENEKGFFCEELEKSSDTAYKLHLGTKQGAGGVSVDLSVDGTFVRIESTYMD